MARERLVLLADGHVFLRLARPWSDGTHGILFERAELLERLAAMTPRPRINLIIYLWVPRRSARTERTEVGEPSGDLREAMASFERTRIAEALDQTGGNVSEAARVLGLSRGALHRKLKEHGLR